MENLINNTELVKSYISYNISTCWKDLMIVNLNNFKVLDILEVNKIDKFLDNTFIIEYSYISDNVHYNNTCTITDTGLKGYLNEFRNNRLKLYLNESK